MKTIWNSIVNEENWCLVVGICLLLAGIYLELTGALSW